MMSICSFPVKEVIPSKQLVRRLTDCKVSLLANPHFPGLQAASFPL